jgi:hypothetical protein
VPQYKLEDFYKLITKRKNEIDDQLYDMLLSFTDFQVFKEMMIDYKMRKIGKSEGFLGLSVEKANFNKAFDNFDELSLQFEMNTKKPCTGNNSTSIPNSEQKTSTGTGEKINKFYK